MNKKSTNKRMDFLPNKLNKYSIRKFTVGTTSILIGSLLFLGTSTDSQAAETTVESTEAATTETPTTEAPTTEAVTTETPTTEAPTTESATTEAPVVVEKATNLTFNADNTQLTGQATGQTVELKLADGTVKTATVQSGTFTFTGLTVNSGDVVEVTVIGSDNTRSEVAQATANVVEEPTTEAPTTEEPTTEAPTTEEPTTEEPTTEGATTEAPTTEGATTEAPTTESATTEAPTTEGATTEAPTTESATTEEPTTEAPTTEEPTTESVTATTEKLNTLTTEAEKKAELTSYVVENTGVTEEAALATINSLNLDYSNLTSEELLAALLQGIAANQDANTVDATAATFASTSLTNNESITLDMNGTVNTLAATGNGTSTFGLAGTHAPIISGINTNIPQDFVGTVFDIVDADSPLSDLTVTFTGLPDGMNYDAATGIVSSDGTVAPGNYTVTITAYDGSIQNNTTSEDFIFTVTANNDLASTSAGSFTVTGNLLSTGSLINGSAPKGYDTISATLSDGTVVSTSVNPDGTYTLAIPAQPEGTVVTFTATSSTGLPTLTTTKTVELNTNVAKPNTPAVTKIMEGDTSASGYVDPNATVTVKDATDTVIGTATADANGLFTVALPAGSTDRYETLTFISSVDGIESVPANMVVAADNVMTDTQEREYLAGDYQLVEFGRIGTDAVTGEKYIEMDYTYYYPANPYAMQSGEIFYQLDERLASSVTKIETVAYLALGGEQKDSTTIRNTTEMPGADNVWSSAWSKDRTDPETGLNGIANVGLLNPYTSHVRFYLSDTFDTSVLNDNEYTFKTWTRWPAKAGQEKGDIYDIGSDQVTIDLGHENSTTTSTSNDGFYTKPAKIDGATYLSASNSIYMQYVNNDLDYGLNAKNTGFDLNIETDPGIAALIGSVTLSDISTTGNTGASITVPADYLIIDPVTGKITIKDVYNSDVYQNAGFDKLNNSGVRDTIGINLNFIDGSTIADVMAGPVDSFDFNLYVTDNPASNPTDIKNAQDAVNKLQSRYLLTSATATQNRLEGYQDLNAYLQYKLANPTTVFSEESLQTAAPVPTPTGNAVNDAITLVDYARANPTLANITAATNAINSIPSLQMGLAEKDAYREILRAATLVNGIYSAGNELSNSYATTFVDVADTDRDRLLDISENILGIQSNFQNPDTDGDGILDGDEVFTTQTDPNVAPYEWVQNDGTVITQIQPVDTVISGNIWSTDTASHYDSLDARRVEAYQVINGVETLIASTTSAADTGDWSLTLAGAKLVDGASIIIKYYTDEVTAKDENGNTVVTTRAFANPEVSDPILVTSAIADTTAPTIVVNAETVYPGFTDITPIDVTVYDASEPVTVEVTGLPPGLEYDKTLGQIIGNAQEFGTKTVTVTATDAEGNIATTIFDITIANIQFPKLDSIQNPTYLAGENIELEATAIGVNRFLSVNIYDIENGQYLYLDNYEGMILGTINTPGVYNVEIVGLDAYDNETTQDITITILDATAPEPPTVNPPQAGATTIKGTGIPGGTVTITFPDGTQTTAIVDANGNYEAAVPADTASLVLGDVVSATQHGANNVESLAGNATVIDTIPSPAPVIKPVTSEDTVITGTGTPGETITVTFPDGTTGTSIVDVDGTWTMEIPANVDLVGGETLPATSTDSNGNVSPEATTVVTDKTASAAPVIKPVTSEDTVVTGTGTPGEMITVTFPDGTTGTGTVQLDGTWTVNIPSGVDLVGGETLPAVSTDSNGNVSPEATTVVTDKTASSAPVIKPVTSEDTVVTGTGTPGETITVTFPDGTTETGTVQPDGTWTVNIPSGVNLVGGETLPAVSTDSNGNVSPEATTVVTDKTASAAPVIKPVTSEDTVVTGTGIPGETITVTFPDGTTETGTVQPDGTWIVNIPSGVDLVGGETLPAVSTDSNGNVSPEATIVVTDKTASAAPVIKPVTSEDTVVTGTGTPGETITVTFPDGTTGTGTVQPDGTWAVNIPSGVDLVGGETLPAVSTDSNGNVSPEATIVVTDKTASAAPVIKPVTSEDTVVTGTGTPGETITVTFPDGTTGTGTVQPDGTWIVNIPSGVDLVGGETLPAVSTDSNGNVSPEATIVVTDKTASAAPVIKPVTSEDTVVTGTGTPGETITVTFPDGTTGTGTVQPDGTWTVNIPSGVDLVGGETLPAVSTDSNGNVSPEATTVVYDVTDPVVNVDPLSAGDTTVSGTSEPGSKITVVLPDGTSVETTTNPDGTWSVTVPALQPGETVSAVSTDGSNNTSGPDTEVVPAATADTTPPVINVSPVSAGDTTVSGTSEPGSKITVVLPDGTSVETTTNPDGTWSVTVPALQPGETVSAVSTDGSNNTSGPDTEVVPAATADTTPPVINVSPVSAGDTTVSGTSEPGSKITVVLPDGTSVETTTNPDGTWSVTVPALQPGETVSAVSTDGSNNTSGPDTEVVPAATADTTPPVINVSPVSAGDTTVSGTSEPGSKITVVLPDGTSVETTTNPDGTWSVTVPALQPGETVSAVSTDGSNNTSGPDTEVVPAATADTTPPVINVSPVSAGDTTVSGTSEPGSKITVVLPDGTSVETTTNPDGTWSVTVPALQPGETVSAVSTDGSNNTSGPDTEVVPAATADTTPPVINVSPVSAGDTTVSGTSEPGSKITVVLPDGTSVETTTNPDGTWSVTVPALQPGETVSAVSTDGSNNTSGPDTEVVPAATADTTPPVINVSPVSAGDTTVSGTSEPGSKITVVLPDGTSVETTTNPDGTWSVTVPALQPGETVSAVSTDGSNNTSGPDTEVVPAATADTTPPVINVSPVSAGDTTVSGTSEPGSKITVVLPDGTSVETTTNPDGTWSVTVPALQPGETVSAVSTDGSNNTSGPDTEVVPAATADTTPPVINVSPVSAGDTTVSGTSEPGSKITVVLPDGTSVETTTNPDGTWSVTVPALQPGETVSAVSTDGSNNTSGPDTEVVPAATADTTPPVINVSPVSAGDTTVSGTSEPGSKITVVLPDGTSVETTTNPDGTWSVTVPALQPGETVSAVSTDGSNNTSGPDTEVVPAATADTTPPVIDLLPIKAGDTTVNGTSEPGSKITVILPDGTTVTTVTNSDSTWSVEVPEIKEGETISALATDEDGNISESTSERAPSSTIVIPPSDTTAPAINLAPIKAGDTVVSGTSEPGSKVTVILPDGTTMTTVTNPDGTWSVEVPAIKDGETVSAVATDASGNTSKPDTETAPTAAADTTAPAINLAPIKAGDTVVSGTSEPGSIITVILPDGTTVTTVTNPDGTWNVTVPALQPGETVSAIATDASGNTSKPDTETAPSATADTTAPAINLAPIKAGDTVVSGTSEPGSIITVILPDGTTVTTVTNSDSTWSVEVPAIKEGETVSAVATDASGNTSKPDAETAPTAAADTTAPAINLAPIKAGDTVVSGTSEPGSIITVILPDGTTVTAVTNPDGTWSLEVPAIKEGETISAVATDGSGNTSKPDTETAPTAAADTTAPAINLAPIKAGDTVVSGTSEPGSIITVILPDGTTVTTVTNSDSTWSVEIPAIKEGETVSAVATDASGNTSKPDAETAPTAAADTTAPAINLAPIKAGDTVVSGTSEPGSIITVILPDGTTVTAVTNPDGTWSVEVPAIKEGETVSAVATDGSGNTSKPDTETAPTAAADTTAPAINLAPIKAGDTVVSGTSEPGSIITVILPDGTTVTAVTNPDGTWSVEVPAIKEGETVSAVATDGSGNTSKPDTETAPTAAADTTAPAINLAPIKAGDTVVSGTSEPGSIITVILPDGTTVTAVTNPDGTWSVEVPAIKEGETVSAVATDASGNTSKPDTETAPVSPIVTPPADTTAPVIDVNPVKVGDTVVSGTSEPGSTVIVTLPDGTTVTTVTNPDGTWSLEVPAIKEGETVSAVATDASGNTSKPDTETAPVSPIVTPPADTTAPVIDVNPVKPGDTIVSGTSEPGSTVIVTLPGGATVTTVTKPDSTWTVIVPPLKSGETVIAIAKDDAGNVSEPSSETVPTEQINEPPVVTPPTVTPPVVDVEPPVIDVDPIKPGHTVVTGTSEPGSTIIVTLPNGEVVKTIVKPDGTWIVTVPPLKEGDTVEAVAIDDAGNTSDVSSETVPVTTKPEQVKPEVKPSNTQATLPDTGEADNGAATAALLAAIGGFALLAARRRRQDEVQTEEK
ncbi:YSIRK-type signal peptide-containing protein [Macrococcoides canis]|uniref:Ig-like domain-containing protein n=1 Tax=Macrococcoides canis TaxID=1855823 RepID=UPI001AEBC9C8|nr:Ig-like domain-containing protein [Macrococcus canis]QTQ07948.1 YSIRK-type signal peptide-containing protein [Macrococcus canis]